MFLAVTVAGSFNFWLFTIGYILTSGGQPAQLNREAREIGTPSQLGDLGGGGHEVTSDKAALSRTALVMPIYNEDVKRVSLGIRQTWLSILQAGLGQDCDFFILSDSTEPEICAREDEMMAHLVEEFSPFRGVEVALLGHGTGRSLDTLCSVEARGGEPSHLGPPSAEKCDSPLFLLRRKERTKYKAGNVADFLERCGWRYDFMVVLDADSVMLGNTIKRLILSLQERPRTAILQTIVLAIRAATPFARMMQFGNARCIPLFSRGMDWFFGPESIYWGHNAIIRIAPFMEHCNLPIMPGKPPLGGHIMSQDIVEAALLGRAGWAVEWDTESRGSYDETPSNILSYGLRDRRWCQGNLQHFWLIFGDRMKLGHRLYFANGIFSYAGSALFLLLTTLAFVQGLRGRFYEITPLLVGGFLAFYLLLLMLPKILGIIHRVRTAGRVVTEVASGLLELVLSTLVSASLVYLHTRFILEILCGRISAWKSPSRNPNESLSWGTASRLLWLPTLLGLGWLVWAWLKTPGFLIYLGPLISGWLLSIPLAVWTSSPRLGAWLERRGLLGSTLTPDEKAELGPLVSE